jgi:2-C-methyl-D-erythritol 4-phosphate cytidylyltransferase
LRMGSEIPKQFLLLGDKPLLMHTLEAFFNADPGYDVILVLPESQFAYWEDLCVKYKYKRKFQLVKGGESRYHSVKNGLSMVTENGLVAVHDGVRPFPGRKLIENIFKEAENKGNSVPVLPVNDSMRQVLEGGNIAVDRTLYKLVQTPQCFPSDVLKAAYDLPFRDSFTDESTVVEALGIKIFLVDGDPGNIKITRPEDLAYASARVTEKK